jgi:hypothetical protein
MSHSNYALAAQLPGDLGETAPCSIDLTKPSDVSMVLRSITNRWEPSQAVRESIAAQVPAAMAFYSPKGEGGTHARAISRLISVIRLVLAMDAYADFHALRHTFITGLVSGRVNPKVAQTLARHGSIGLTMDRYTHLYAGNLASALDVLPDLSNSSRETARATGTDGNAATIRLSPGLSLSSEVGKSLVESDAVNFATMTDAPILENTANFSEKTLILTREDASATLCGHSRRSGRVVDCAGLENR